MFCCEYSGTDYLCYCTDNYTFPGFTLLCNLYVSTNYNLNSTSSKYIVATIGVNSRYRIEVKSVVHSISLKVCIKELQLLYCFLNVLYMPISLLQPHKFRLKISHPKLVLLLYHTKTLILKNKRKSMLMF